MKKRMQRFVVALMATMMFTSISPVSALATEMPSHSTYGAHPLET